MLLEEYGANVSARATLGTTPLHAAAVNGSVNVLHTLVKHGADVNAQVRLSRQRAEPRRNAARTSLTPTNEHLSIEDCRETPTKRWWGRGTS